MSEPMHLLDEHLRTLATERLQLQAQLAVTLEDRARVGIRYFQRIYNRLPTEVWVCWSDNENIARTIIIAGNKITRTYVHNGKLKKEDTKIDIVIPVYHFSEKLSTNFTPGEVYIPASGGVYYTVDYLSGWVANIDKRIDHV